jgi:hypothetical protein
VAAAVSAARQGCSVVLAERTDRLGGIGTRGMLRTVCGLYQNGGTEALETLNAGMVRDIATALQQRSRSSVTRMGKVFVLSCSAAELENVLLSLCHGQQGLHLAVNAAVTAAMARDHRVTEIALERQGIRETIRPAVVVDCTGDGELAVLAGAGYELSGPGEIQMAGFTVHVRGLVRSDASLAVKVPLVLARAAEEGRVAATMRFTNFSPGDTLAEGYLKFTIDAAQDERQARAAIEKAIELLREQLPFFKDAAIEQMSGILQREGRRIIGDYVLTEEDVLAGRKFPDGAVRNSWPIELWDTSRGTQYRYPPDNDHYEIPFRCLTVKGFRNLLTAGRCISVTHAALGSTRVMGTCMALGDVAGRAAAEFAKKGRYPDFKTERN